MKVTDVMINAVLKEMERTGETPWQRPYKRFYPMSWVSKSLYHGINRIILPSGEYLTAYQINKINQETGTNYRFQKGIQWYPVIFYKETKKSSSLQELKSLFNVEPDIEKAIAEAKECGIAFIGGDFWTSFYVDGCGNITKVRQISQYSLVAERGFFKDGEKELPSKLKSGEVEITNSNALSVINNYLKGAGIRLQSTLESPYYSVTHDYLAINKHQLSEEGMLGCIFHEMAHSTGSSSRLNRKQPSYLEDFEGYAKEEVIAEITACFLCAECGIDSFVTSGTRQFENSASYCNHYKKYIKQWGAEFLSICSQAEKAFNYIMQFSIAENQTV